MEKYVTIAHKARVGFDKFMKLESLDDSSKQALKRLVRRYQISSAVMDYKSERYVEIIAMVFSTVLLITFILLPFLLSNWLGFSFPLRQWILIYVGYWLAWLLAVIILFAPFIFYSLEVILYELKEEGSSYKGYISKSIFGRLIKFNRYLFLLLLLGWPILFTFLYTFLLSRLYIGLDNAPSTLTYMLFITILAALCMVLFILLIGIITWYIQYAMDRSFNINHPEVVITIKLIDLLFYVESRPASWEYISYKRNLLSDIAEVATRIQYDLPRKLSIGDDEADRWTKSFTAGIAAALRDKRRLVFTENKEDFKKDLAQALQHVIPGNWQNLDHAEPQVLTRSDKFSYVKKILQAIIIGLLPLVIFWAIQLTKYAIAAPLADTILIISIIWLILSIFAAVDPLYKDKVNALKGVRDLLPF